MVPTDQRTTARALFVRLGRLADLAEATNAHTCAYWRNDIMSWHGTPSERSEMKNCTNGADSYYYNIHSNKLTDFRTIYWITN